MDNLIKRLNSIPNAYFEFIDSTLDYAKSKPEHLELLNDYFDNHKNPTISDIIRLISTQPDFYEDELVDDIKEAIM